MSVTIPVAHDFCCRWCWFGLYQIRRLEAEFDVHFEWLSYELFPEALGPPVTERRSRPENAPATPSRADLAARLEGIENPSLPGDFPTLRAHQAVLIARDYGTQRELIERIYKAYWQHGLAINEPQVLAVLARGLVPDTEELLQLIRGGRYANEVVAFDEDAHESGVWNVPTFWIGGDRYAEQPYAVLREAISKLAAPKVSIYSDLIFPAPPESRPYTMINMVTTIDGKTVTGERDEHVMDLGSKVDHLLMRRLEAAIDAVILGAGSLRSTPNLWYPEEQMRIVVTRSGDLDYGSRFFSVAPQKSIVVGPANLTPPDPIRRLDLGLGWTEILRIFRQEFGIKTLLIEGGSELNASLLEVDVVDELFLTLAPKIKLGRTTPTYAGGEPLPRERIQQYRLVEEHRVEDEIFLRYRRAT
jgi:predicted DsbA family dithiol-disulfide isomerase/riboflavin biosynthesis pyrimidine reductase